MEDFEQRDDFGNLEANLVFLRRSAALALQPGLVILEVGSGKGKLLSYLRGEGHDVRGVEVNTWMIDESRRLYGDLPITPVSGTALPFPDAAFDIVLSFDVLEHIPDTDAHLAEVRRVLKTGGRYLFQTPNKWTNTVFETLRWRSFTAWRKDHCSLHSHADIRRRFGAHRFAVEFHDVPVVTDFFRRKVRHYLGAPGVLALKVINPDTLPLSLRTNFYVVAMKR